MALLIAPLEAEANGGMIVRVKVAADGSNAGGYGVHADIAPGGRFVAFTSNADNVGAGSGSVDIWLRDLHTDTTELITETLDGGPPNWSEGASVSRGGRFVAFSSLGKNLVSGTDEDWDDDVFLRDTHEDTTTRITRGIAGTEAHGDHPQVAAEGRFVAFASRAANLVPNDTNGARDIFVFDSVTEDIRRVSISNSEGQFSRSSFNPAISADGRFVAFEDNVNAWGRQEVMLRDRKKRSTRKITLSYKRTRSNGHNDTGGISANGRWIVLRSSASNLVPHDTNDQPDIFVYNRTTDRIRRVSFASHGAQSNGDVGGSDIAANGRYVVYRSFATNIVPADKDILSDAFIFDRELRTTRLVTRGSCASKANGRSFEVTVSAHGRFVSFTSTATNLVAGDAQDDDDDVYVRDMSMTC